MLCWAHLANPDMSSPVRAGLERGSPEYETLKRERSEVLWRGVEKVIPDIRKRVEIEMVCPLELSLLYF
jgi:hypothetical protein